MLSNGKSEPPHSSTGRRRTTMRITDQHLLAVAWGVLTLGLVLCVLACGGCGSTPPTVESGSIRGAITLDTPQGPITVDLGTGLVLAPGEGWALSHYELQAETTIAAGGIVHVVGIEAEGPCVRVRYAGVAVVSAPVPGTVCEPPAAAP
jgi:hypothetical protein